MDSVAEKPSFSFEVPLKETAGIEPLITSEGIEKKIAEQVEADVPKKRGRKPGSTNKKVESTEVPEYVKKMFGPLVVGVHNALCKVLKVSILDKDQEKMVSEGYAMLLHKRIPTIIENHGDIIAAIGATAFVIGAKLSTETKLFEFKSKENKENGKTEQHNDNTGPEGFGQNGTVKVPFE